jgi:Tfp pilus assembly protein PilV
VNAARTRHGSALIDVLLALVLLAIAGTALVVLLGQTSRSMRDSLESEHLARRASEQLAWLSTETRAGFDARLGRTNLRGWTLDVRVASSTLFDVSIAMSDTSAPLLHTLFYRPDTNPSPK